MDLRLELFFEQYCAFSNDLKTHFMSIRERAWSTHNYPCIGGFYFLEGGVYASPFYDTILRRLIKQDQIFLDLGCGFGQELRKLAFVGAPVTSLFGADLEADFISLGYELFMDRDVFPERQFMVSDIFDEGCELFARFTHRVDILYIGQFLHLFPWKMQLTVVKMMLKLLKPVPGSVVVGWQLGSTMPGEYPKRTALGGWQSMYRHDVETLRRLWDEAGASVRIRAWMTEWADDGRIIRTEHWANRQLHFIIELK